MAYRPTVENLRSLGNFSQTFRWAVAFSSFPSALSGSFDSDNINFRAESMSIPELEIETTEIQIRGNKVRQAGIGTYNSPITLTLNETTDGYALQFLGAWQEAGWKSSDGSPGTTEYKENLECTMILYLLDNQDKPYYKFTLYGCQLSGATKGDADAGTADPLKPALSIAYDYFNKERV
jgi:hypothetical protein